MTARFKGEAQPRNKQRSLGLAWWTLTAAILITVACKVIPLAVNMPVAGLDESWKLAMNQVIAERMSLGRDIVFTYGPYAFLYTKMYHPLIDRLAMASSIYLAASYAFVLFGLLRGSSTARLACLWFALMVPSQADNIFYLYPLLVGLFCCSVADCDAQSENEAWLAGRLFVAFFPFGLIGLVKGSFMILCAAIAVFAALYFLARRRGGAVVAVLAALAISVPFFWAIAEQRPTLLPEYFYAVGQIASGYADAMSMDGRGWEVIAYLVASLVTLLLIGADAEKTASTRLFVFSLFAIYLFLAFKGGFVRHDGHAIISGAAVLLGAAALLATQRSGILMTGFFVAACVHAFIASGYASGDLSNVFRYKVAAAYVDAWRGAVLRVTAADQLRLEYDKAMQAIRKSNDLSAAEGGVDIYSVGQSYLLASGGNWDPRPTIQSYVAYTPWLAGLNKAHLLGEHAPENILFKVEPLDAHLASTEDGASWPILLTRYQPSQQRGDYLQLTARPEHSGAVDPTTPLSEPVEALFGTRIPVPDSRQPVIARVVIKPSLFGSFVDMLYKRHRLAITVNFQDGKSMAYRFVARMAEAGFVISPLVEDTRDFTALYGDPELLAHKKVASFVIDHVGGEREWQPTFSVVFRQLQMPQPIDVAGVLGIDKAVALPVDKQLADAGSCSGSIDLVSGTQAKPTVISSSSWLSIEGWLAKSVNRGTLTDATWLIFTSSEDKSVYFRVRATPRPDVAAYFNHPGLAMAGYAVAADVSGMHGEYSLGLGYTDGDRLLVCPQPKLKVILGSLHN